MVADSQAGKYAWVMTANNSDWRRAVLQRHRWMIFLLPFLAYMLVGSLEPAPGGCTLCFAGSYPWVYAVKIALTVAAIAFVWPGYGEFPLRLSVLALLVGAVGGPLWIGLCALDWEHTQLLPLLDRFGLGWMIAAGDRAAFDPLEQLADQPALARAFLAVRFFGLVAVVPLMEEFFLRGFVMRLAVDHDWWNVPFGKVNRLAIVLGTAVPMLTHPGELLAAAVWFSMITWLMLRTRNIWDCVAAHAVTNLILGVYVVWFGAWRLM
jgi:CAAX prenyl protease-like protein